MRYYDPTDIFGDLAEAIADAYPAVAREAEEEGTPEADDAAADEEPGEEGDEDGAART